MFKPITVKSRVTEDRSISKTTEEKLALNKSSVKLKGGELYISLDSEVVIIYTKTGEEVFKGGTEQIKTKKGIRKIIMLQDNIYKALEEEYGGIIGICEAIETKGVQETMRGIAKGESSTIIIAGILEESVIKNDKEERVEEIF